MLTKVRFCTKNRNFGIHNRVIGNIINKKSFDNNLLSYAKRNICIFPSNTKGRYAAVAPLPFLRSNINLLAAVNSSTLKQNTNNAAFTFVYYSR